jgi:hypothetical protein
MFHGHTLVECHDADEALIMRLMSEPAENRERMRAFLEKVERECVPATLDCVPENASSITQHGTVQATGLLTVDSQHWTPELPERIGLYHAYIRGFNRDIRTHRLFIVCSGGMARASDLFCNMAIDVGHRWSAQVWLCHFTRSPKLADTDVHAHAHTGHLRLAGGVVAAEGVPAGAVPADQGAGGRVRDPRAVDPGHSLLLDLARKHVVHCEGMQEHVVEPGEQRPLLLLAVVLLDAHALLHVLVVVATLGREGLDEHARRVVQVEGHALAPSARRASR